MSANTYQTSVIYIYINLCSPTLKSYVGFTTNLPKRKRKHLYDVSRGSNTYFHRSIRKYGWENFACFILEETNDIKLARDVLESHYIKICNSFHTKNGYNLTLGGDGMLGFTHSKKSKTKIGNANKGTRRSNEVREKNV
jgi:group I intron endonuclease